MAKLPEYKVPRDPSKRSRKERHPNNSNKPSRGLVIFAISFPFLIAFAVITYVSYDAYCHIKENQLPSKARCDYIKHRFRYTAFPATKKEFHKCCIRQEYEMNKDNYWPSYWIPIIGHGIDRNCDQHLE